MQKMIVSVTQEFESIQEAEEMYEEISGELRAHETLHINCRIVQNLTGYSPENPQGHEVPV